MRYATGAAFPAPTMRAASSAASPRVPLSLQGGLSSPISSIGLEQDSVDLRTMTPAKLCVRGRHDTCPATRAVPIVEAVCALVVLDSILTWPADPEATTRHQTTDGRKERTWTT